MKRRNLVYCEEYESKGEKKRIWHDCGTMFINEENGNISIKLTSFPLNGSIMAFPEKKKEEVKEAPKQDSEMPF